MTGLLLAGVLLAFVEHPLMKYLLLGALAVFVGCATVSPPTPTVARVVRLPKGGVTVCDTSVACAGGLELGRCGAYYRDLGCVVGARDLGPYDEFEGEVTE